MATNGQGGELYRTLTSDGGVAIRTLEATDLVAEAARRHQLGPLATQALGRVLIGAILLGAGGKHDETVQLRFNGNGPLGTLLAVADEHARVRGYASRPLADLPLRGGELDVAGGIGFGELSVVRHRRGWRQPYTGIVPIVSGEVGEDLALYLTESEQTPSAIGLGVALGPRGEVVAAGGFLAQALPGAADETLARLEANVAALSSPSRLCLQRGGAQAMVDVLVDGLGGQALTHQAAAFHCHCDEDRVIQAVALLGRDEAEALSVAGEKVEVRCEFCAELYRVDPDRVRALFPDA
ncbi:MAG: Hsp33 family molecular chaperone HslO [Deltaproteobacteria bacterium]|nr:Hsp33 family molecular chaperone HslO [Deltaproteobacteria bacterium]MBW2395940.1 Hsp33 family molecular chaperone HslO [Deltaproteobacteria bacterium]